MENTKHVNPFEEVHKKAQAAKDRARKVREEDTELRERNEQSKAASEDAKDKTHARLVSPGQDPRPTLLSPLQRSRNGVEAEEIHSHEHPSTTPTLDALYEVPKLL